MKFPLSETIRNLSLLTFVVEKMKVDVLMMDFGWSYWNYLYRQNSWWWIQNLEILFCVKNLMLIIKLRPVIFSSSNINLWINEKAIRNKKNEFSWQSQNENEPDSFAYNYVFKAMWMQRRFNNSIRPTELRFCRKNWQ